MRGKKKLSGIMIFFILMLLYPAAGKITDRISGGLAGTSAETAFPEFSWKAVMDGGYQEELGSYLLEKIPGKAFLVKLRNQILYSVFRVSPNSNVVIGKEEQLFEPEYLDYSLDIYGQPGEEEISGLVQKLELLQEKLDAAGKELYIFITPSKARYYQEDAPDYYQFCSDGSAETELAYDKFRKELGKTELKVFDSIAYINEIKDDFSYPLFYSTGIHWSRVLGSTVAEEFNRYLNRESRYQLGQVSFTYEETDTPEAPDADLYNTLNLFTKPSVQYYKVFVATEEGKDKPDVFVRGGSFMGQSLSYLISGGIFGNDIHFENNYYFTDRYSRTETLSGFDAYDEFDVKTYLEDADILILEVNEEKIWTMSWGFIDYALGCLE